MGIFWSIKEPFQHEKANSAYEANYHQLYNVNAAWLTNLRLMNQFQAVEASISLVDLVPCEDKFFLVDLDPLAISFPQV